MYDLHTHDKRINNKSRFQMSAIIFVNKYNYSRNNSRKLNVALSQIQILNFFANYCVNYCAIPL